MIHPVDNDGLDLYEEDEYGDSNVYKIIERELNKNKNKAEVFRQQVLHNHKKISIVFLGGL